MNIIDTYKHTDYPAEYIALRKKLKAELRAAVLCHKGSYTFPDDNLGPYVPVAETESWCIKSVSMDKEGNITAVAVPESKPKSNLIQYPLDKANTELLYYLTDEAQEGGKAFLEKRKPDFKKYPKFP